MMTDPTSDHDLLIRLDQKVNDLIFKVGTLTDDHEMRIRTLEKNQWRWSGIAGVLGAALTILINLIIKIYIK